MVHEGDAAMEPENLDWEPELLVDQEEEMVEQVAIVAKKATLWIPGRMMELP